LADRGRGHCGRQRQRLSRIEAGLHGLSAPGRFWVDEDANSGVYIRCTNPDKVGGDSGYEVNIYDKRPDPSYGTGAIVNVAKVEPMPKAGGKWNVYEITAKGPQFTVILNGQKTVDGAQDSTFASGRIALQYGASVVKEKGIVKFRKVEIKPW
jgi:hypothetical protein